MINEQIISQSNNIKDCLDDLPYDNIPALIYQLMYANNNIRLQVRAVLSCIGKPAIPDLVNALDDADAQQRWHIIKTLDSIRDPAAVPALVRQLDVDNADVRWAASNALIGLRRDAIPPLLEALTHDYDSMPLRQSIHHIFHVFKDRGLLSEAEIKVYDALDDIEPTVIVPWVAKSALEHLKTHKNQSRIPKDEILF
jgi:HEAT repeat protein